MEQSIIILAWIPSSPDVFDTFILSITLTTSNTLIYIDPTLLSFSKIVLLCFLSHNVVSYKKLDTRYLVVFLTLALTHFQDVF